MEQPSSPGNGQVDLRDCINQLLKFVLESHIDKTLELDLGLSRDYCRNLLREDSRDQGEGVLPSPSYKRIALLLHELITCTKSCETNRAAWGEMLAGKGSELLDVLCTSCSRGFFYTIERIAAGALILFNKCLILEVEDIHSYNSFPDMLVAEGLQNVLPGVKTTEEEIKFQRH